jgi:hypothetical protein
MKKFVKITTREGEAILRSWIDVEKIAQISQNSITQAGQNEGTIIFADGVTMQIIAFDETIDSLNK